MEELTEELRASFDKVLSTLNTQAREKTVREAFFV